MPKSPTSPNVLRSPRTINPYHTKENISPSLRFATQPSKTSKKALAIEVADHQVVDGAVSLAETSRLAVASADPSDRSYRQLKGSFLRSGVHVFSKSGRHAISDPFNDDVLSDGKKRKPRWLQLQFNVVVPDASDWECELILFEHGNLKVGQDYIVAVQTGGTSVERRGGKFTLQLKPSGDAQDDPRMAISYFIEYTEKAYVQALDGCLPYHFLLTRVDGSQKKTRWWR